MDKQQQAAIILAVDCILDAAKAAEPLGAPSGVIYAALMAHGMRLATYESLVNALVRAGRITVENHLIRAVAA